MGYVRAGSYGHTLGGAVGLVMIEGNEAVTSEYLTKGSWEIEIAGNLFPCELSIKPIYDPENRKIKA